MLGKIAQLNKSKKQTRKINHNPPHKFHKQQYFPGGPNGANIYLQNYQLCMFCIFYLFSLGAEGLLSSATLFGLWTDTQTPQSQTKAHCKWDIFNKKLRDKTSSADIIQSCEFVKFQLNFFYSALLEV